MTDEKPSGKIRLPSTFIRKGEKRDGEFERLLSDVTEAYLEVESADDYDDHLMSAYREARRRIIAHESALRAEVERLREENEKVTSNALRLLTNACDKRHSAVEIVHHECPVCLKAERAAALKRAEEWESQIKAIEAVSDARLQRAERAERAVGQLTIRFDGAFGGYQCPFCNQGRWHGGIPDDIEHLPDCYYAELRAREGEPQTSPPPQPPAA